MVADFAADGLDVGGGNFPPRRVEIPDEAGLPVGNVLVHGRVVVDHDAFAAGDLLQERHADAFLGARGDVHAEAVEKRGVFLGRQEVALDDKLVQRIGFKQRADCRLLEIAAIPVKSPARIAGIPREAGGVRRVMDGQDVPDAAGFRVTGQGVAEGQHGHPTLCDAAPLPLRAPFVVVHGDEETGLAVDGDFEASRQELPEDDQIGCGDFVPWNPAVVIGVVVVAVDGVPRTEDVEEEVRRAGLLVAGVVDEENVHLFGMVRARGLA